MSRSRDGAQTRARLLTATAELLVEGDGEIEIGQIADRAGVSTGLPYHHFGSKGGIVSAVVEDFYRRWDAVANQRLDGPWAVRERRRHEASIRFLSSEPLAPIVFGMLSRTPKAVAVAKAHETKLIELAARNIRAGQDSGEIPGHIDADLAAAAVIGALEKTATHTAASREPHDTDELIDQTWAFVVGILQLRDR